MTSTLVRRTPARLDLIPPNRRPRTGKGIGLTTTGPQRVVRIRVPDARHHLHIPGPTGLGKTELLATLGLQDTIAARGLAVLDLGAKGDLTNRLLDRLPADCGKRLVIIDAADPRNLPAVNLVDPATYGGSPHQVAAHLSTVMAKAWPAWGHRIADIAHHAILTLAATPGTTLADLPLLLTDTRWRDTLLATAARRLGPLDGRSLRQFWDAYDNFPVTQTAPLLARLRLVFAQPIAVRLFGTPATTFRFSDILDGGILLIRLPPGDLGDDGTQLIASLLLTGLWRAATARAALPEHQRLDAGVLIDEAQHALHLPVAVQDALTEARGLHVSLTLAHQHLDQLPPATLKAVNANARNKIYFALEPADADDQARHVEPFFTGRDLARLGRHEVIFRPVIDSHATPALTVRTVKAPPAIPGRAAQLRRAAARHTGLSEPERRRLLTEAVTSRPHQPDTHPAPVPVRSSPPAPERDTFRQPGT